MAATASAAADLRQSADPEDSNVSSPLSEVDDKDENGEGIEDMEIDMDEGGKSNASDGDENANANDDGQVDGGSDSESALSEAGSDLESAANDTEAETERLYDTPKHHRQKDVIIDQYNNGQVFEHTPSRLRRTARSNHAGDEASISGEDASDASSADEADDSPTKQSRRTSAGDDDKDGGSGRKRKRSPGADNSESDQPLRKRLDSVAAGSDDGDDDTGTNDDEKLAAQLQGQDSDDDGDTATDRDATEQNRRAAKRGTRSDTKRSGLVNEEDGEAATDAQDETAEATADEIERPGADGEAEAEEEEEQDEAEIAARNQEEMERKQAAFNDWVHIEDRFAIFRDRLYSERLQRIDDEEQSLVANVPTHKEYLNMKQCLDDRLSQKLQEVNTEFEFQVKAREQWAVAERAQVWSQFFQAVREKREQMLEALNKQWYDVQTARRSAHSVTDYGILFPKDHTQRVRNAIAYNTEVSTLSGLAKYEGFPAGPEMKGASATELKADLQAMERTRKARQRPSYPSRENLQTGGFDRLGPAGEQFLKDTPWANPSHSSHRMNQQAQTENGAAATIRNNQPPHADIKTPFEAATLQKSPALSNRLSESPEMSRSILNASAHQMKRMGSVPSIGRGSKAAAV